MSKLSLFMDDAIRKMSKKNSAHLGDRSVYIGASDIGCCPRKVVLGKLKPEEHCTKTLLYFARGHLAEDLVANIFRAGGLKFNRQHTVIHPQFPYLLCHIDFIFDTGNRLHVVEVKSTDGIPDEPYSSWVEQLHFQMGLVAANNPRIEVTGSLLVVDVNRGKWEEFNSFVPNDLVFNILVEKGHHMRAAMLGEIEPRIEAGLLCGCCLHQDDCPAFADCMSLSLPDEVNRIGIEYIAANAAKSAAETILKRLKNDILSFTGEGKYRGASDQVEITITLQPASDIVDSQRLKEVYPDIFDDCQKKKAGFTRVDVKPYKNKSKSKKGDANV